MSTTTLPAVIIRLQNLPLEARSVDIRKFFDKLLIPDGGVHIIGGEKGDAFIAFQSDEDARIAMSRNGFYLCNAQVKLFLSSKQEMQTVIAAARNQHLHHAIKPLAQPPPTPQLQQPTPPTTTNTNHHFNQAELNANGSNSSALLTSLTKFISSSNKSQTSSAPPSNGGYSSAEKLVYEQINHAQKKPLLSMPPPPLQPPSQPTLSQPPPSLPVTESNAKPSLPLNADLLGPLLNDILLKTNKANQTAPSSSSNNNNNSSQNISIDQILSLLQAHKNKENEEKKSSEHKSLPPSSIPSSSSYSSSSSSSSTSSYYTNQTHNSRGDGVEETSSYQSHKPFVQAPYKRKLDDAPAYSHRPYSVGSDQDRQLKYQRTVSSGNGSSGPSTFNNSNNNNNNSNGQQQPGLSKKHFL